jgi:hypothetical protein
MKDISHYIDNEFVGESKQFAEIKADEISKLLIEAGYKQNKDFTIKADQLFAKSKSIAQSIVDDFVENDDVEITIDDADGKNKIVMFKSK